MQFLGDNLEKNLYFHKDDLLISDQQSLEQFNYLSEINECVCFLSYVHEA